MIDLFAILASMFTIKEVTKEALEKPAPKGTRFDWDTYWKDNENGIGIMEQVRKRQSGGYTTTEPLPKMSIPDNGVIDVKRYEHDKKVYGEAIAESWRKSGLYKFVRK